MAHTQNIDLFTLMETFGCEDKCREYLEELRWPEGPVCPRCGCTTISRIKARNQFDCDACRYQFSVKSGTIFHDSHLPLRKWFAAVYLMCESKKGMSANQLKRTLKVAYKTAWYLCHRIREAMRDADESPLRGIVEADETFLRTTQGRRARWNDYRRQHRDHSLILGAIERGGDIKLRVEHRRTKETLHGFVKDSVCPENTEAVYTDELPAYSGLETDKMRHETINHGDEEYVRGDVHTNSIESAFSLFKRSIVGAYHQVSEKHLDAYLSEFEFRFSNRKNPYLFRDTILRLIEADKLEYKKLTAK